MRIHEAYWIQDCIARYVPETTSDLHHVVLNLGSGSRRSREILKPYIDQKTLKPLRGKGYQLINSDLLEGDGIDLSGDLFEPLFQC